MIASLPMYWRDENAPLWQAFWAHVQAIAGREALDLPDLTAPEALPEPLGAHWLRPDLALSMTCGLPFRTVLRDRVTYVGTLGFGLSAPVGHYFSHILVGQDAYDAARPSGLGTGRPLRLAYNAPDSQSGWAVTRHSAPFHAPLAFDGFVQTGSHAASVQAVIEGRADVAYVDAVTFRILKRCGLDASALEMVGQSVTTPALPLICARGIDPGPVRAALRAAVAAFDPGPDPYLMGGPLSFSVLDEALYHAQPVPAPPPG